MANLAVFASGNGSNFEAIAKALAGTEHSLKFLLCNNKNAFVLKRADRLGIIKYLINYTGKSRHDAEEKMIELLKLHRIDLVVLAGFMKILTPLFVSEYSNKIINIHPSLLPKYPGTKGIEESYYSEDKELGITIHFVDTGVDTGKIILQKSFVRSGKETLKEIEERIHMLEHLYYPQVILELLNKTGIK
ncbi:MAG: phosphoribosylglycinamide formyltransferase [Spirochaetales bacterium]|nr:phosphoribosylglycinamide formyltransferase [Spirochaetales bacterium]